ncbi:MAG TPA: VIT1/CCC1 transporter family protein [Terriglobales bacterium]|jgi:VIT1/CCC1 family predicted Fe2+/Mn2+ transporter|nr:VIT1/CCC1 transporter family protein [Terriglobales bacterium]
MPAQEQVMETPHHVERHFTGGEKVRDVVIGMSDGLTVPFALAAGLTGAVAASGLVVVAGLAEIAAGSIAMGLGGYLAARSDAEHYTSERIREQTEVREKPTVEADEITEIFEAYGVKPEESATLVEALKQHPEAWVDFMMRFELGLEKPEPKRALQSAVTIAGSYIVGGLIPLAPYMFIRDTHTALPFSVGVTLVALAAFGYIKGRFTGAHALRSALETVIIGSVAAAAAFGLARLISP